MAVNDDIATLEGALAAHRSDSMLLDGRYYEYGGKKEHDEYDAALDRLAARLAAAEAGVQSALSRLEEAIEATGDDEDELIAQPGNEWVYVICARDDLRAAKGAGDER